VIRGSAGDRGSSKSISEAESGPAAPAFSESVCFVHIPRTAGGTLKEVLSRAFPEGTVNDAGNVLNNPERTAEKLRKLRYAESRILIGHVPYGVYRAHMPAPVRYVTLLREPVDRVVSHFHHDRLRAKPDERFRDFASLESALRQELNLLKPGNMSLMDKVRAFLARFRGSSRWIRLV